MGRLLIISLAYLYAGKMPQTSPAIVTVKATESIVYIGASSMVEIGVDVKEGYHIQANKVNDESLVPTTLEVKENQYVTISKVEFPPSKQFKLEGTDNLLQVYDGKFPIQLLLSPLAKAKTGKYTLGAKLTYQACDAKSCLFPRGVDFFIPIEVKTKK